MFKTNVQLLNICLWCSLRSAGVWTTVKKNQTSPVLTRLRFLTSYSGLVALHFTAWIGVARSGPEEGIRIDPL